MPKKKTKKKSQSHHSTHHHASNNFLLIVAGGFVVLIILMYLIASTNKLQRAVTVPATQATEENASVVTVTVEDGEYSPANITVSKGSSIKFVNNDEDMHTATAVNGSFTTQDLALDTSETLTFDTPGEFAYHCKFHPEMQGIITVVE